MADNKTELLRRRRRLWLLGGSAATLLALVGVTVWALFFSTLLAAKSVLVEGAALISQEEVLVAAQVPLDTPLALIDTAAIEERVKALPDSRDVRVEISYPDTVVITVTEREPVFQLSAGDSFVWVDNTGTIFRVDQPRSSALPEAKADASDERLLAEIAKAVGQLPKEVRDDLQFLEASSLDKIDFKLQGDRTVVWGSADQGELKAQVLSGLLKVSASVYDVSAPTHPTTR